MQTYNPDGDPNQEIITIQSVSPGGFFTGPQIEQTVQINTTHVYAGGRLVEVSRVVRPIPGNEYSERCDVSSNGDLQCSPDSNDNGLPDDHDYDDLFDDNNNDGTPDALEVDNDSDYYNPNPTEDDDGDGLINAIDPDDDDDGTFDVDDTCLLYTSPSPRDS